MRSGWLILMFLVLLAPAASAQSEDEEIAPEDMRFELRRRPYERTGHPSETDRFREVGVGEVGVAWNVYYTVRSYNISDIKGLDNSLSSNWLFAFDPWGLGLRSHIEYRVSNEWRLSFIPRADVAFGILNSSYTNTHELEDLPFTRNYRGANDAQKLSVNFDFEFAARWRFMWFVGKFNSWMVFRRRVIRANDSSYRDPQLGTLSDIKDRKRVDWDQAYLFGGATGVGFEFFFLPESSRFILMALWRPFNHVSFRQRSGVTHGLEFVVRSADFELTNQIGLFFEIGVQMYLPARDFNDIYYTQFSVGVKFR
jgi:hypothetical protein